MRFDSGNSLKRLDDFLGELEDNTNYNTVKATSFNEFQEEENLANEAIRRLEKDEQYQEAQHQLGIKDLLGYNWEMNVSERLKIAKLYRLPKKLGGVVYRNPKNPHTWKRKKEESVDSVYKIGNLTIYAEMGFSSKPYKLGERWFFGNRLPRFNKYKSDNKHQFAYITNRPENLSEITHLFKMYGILIFDVKGFIDYINEQKRELFFDSVCSLSNVSLSPVCSNVPLSPIVLSLNSNHNSSNKETNVYASTEKALEVTNEEIIDYIIDSKVTKTPYYRSLSKKLRHIYLALGNEDFRLWLVSEDNLSY